MLIISAWNRFVKRSGLFRHTLLLNRENAVGKRLPFALDVNAALIEIKRVSEHVGLYDLALADNRRARRIRPDILGGNVTDGILEIYKFEV